MCVCGGGGCVCVCVWGGGGVRERERGRDSVCVRERNGHTPGISFRHLPPRCRKPVLGV